MHSLEAAIASAAQNDWPAPCGAAGGAEALMWAPPPPQHLACREAFGGGPGVCAAGRGGGSPAARPLPLRAVEHATVMAVRFVSLLDAWAGERGAIALYAGQLQLKVRACMRVQVI